MKIVLQRVKQASVSVAGEEIGRIGNGYLLLVGISQWDDEAVADKMMDKIIKLRIFPDQNGKTNLSLDQAAGQIMAISQFTLYADCKRGNRPGFSLAGSPDMARRLYQYILDELERRLPGRTAGGSFGAEMEVSLINDGPFTLVLDSDEMVPRNSQKGKSEDE